MSLFTIKLAVGSYFVLLGVSREGIASNNFDTLVNEQMPPLPPNVTTTQVSENNSSPPIKIVENDGSYQIKYKTFTDHLSFEIEVAEGVETIDVTFSKTDPIVLAKVILPDDEVIEIYNRERGRVQRYLNVSHLRQFSAEVELDLKRVPTTTYVAPPRPNFFNASISAITNFLRPKPAKTVTQPSRVQTGMSTLPVRKTTPKSILTTVPAVSILRSTPTSQGATGATPTRGAVPTRSAKKPQQDQMTYRDRMVSKQNQHQFLHHQQQIDDLSSEIRSLRNELLHLQQVRGSQTQLQKFDLKQNIKNETQLVKDKIDTLSEEVQKKYLQMKESHKLLQQHIEEQILERCRPVETEIISKLTQNYLPATKVDNRHQRKPVDKSRPDICDQEDKCRPYSNEYICLLYDVNENDQEIFVMYSEYYFDKNDSIVIGVCATSSDERTLTDVEVVEDLAMNEVLRLVLDRPLEHSYPANTVIRKVIGAYRDESSFPLPNEPLFSHNPDDAVQLSDFADKVMNESEPKVFDNGDKKEGYHALIALCAIILYVMFLSL